jgi:hypothetical protein
MKSNNFETSAELFLAEIKTEREEGGGRIVLGDNTGGGAVIVRSIRFRSIGIWFSAGLPCIYMHS